VLAAVKVVHRDLAADPAFRARFADEVAAARRVAPFCTARVLDADPAADPPYLATEYIDGVPLGQAVAEGGPLDESTLHGVALGVAAALAAIHSAGVVHRDLKPGNVLLSRSGPRVIDFGIARAMDLAASHTMAGTVLGTPGWMAPEQFSGGPVGPAADVFSWASLVGYAATGRNPWGDEGPPAALAYRIIHRQPDLTGLRGPLRGLVEAALCKDPAHRPAARDLVLALLGARMVPGPGADPTVSATNLLQRTWAGAPEAQPASAGSPGGAAPNAGGPPAPRVPRPPAPAPTAVVPPRTAVLPPRTAVLPPGTAALPARTAAPARRTAAPPPRTATFAPRAAAPARPVDPRRPAAVPHQPAGPARARSRRRWHRKKRYVIPLALVVLLLVTSSSAGRRLTNGSTGRSPGSTSSARPQIGVPVRDGQLEFVLTRWQCGVPEIGQGIWAHPARGQFCLADLTVRDIGRESRTLFEPLVKLYDTDGKRHDPDVSARFYLGQQSLWGGVDPGQTISGTAAFDIPETARGDRLELHDGVLSGGTRLLL